VRQPRFSPSFELLLDKISASFEVPDIPYPATSPDVRDSPATQPGRSSP
jgi:hypothetical protein